MMTIKPATPKDLRLYRGPIAMFAFEDSGLAGVNILPSAVKKRLWERAQDENFSARAGEIAYLREDDGSERRRFIIAGLGKRREFETEALRLSAGALFRHARDRMGSLWVVPYESPRVVAEGLLLASHEFTDYKKPERRRLEDVRLLAQRMPEIPRVGRAVERAGLYAEAVCFARDLVNKGPSDKSPDAVAGIAKTFARRGSSVKVIGKARAEKLGMGALLGVSRGSDSPPCVLHLTYKPPEGAKRRVALVGKGVLFDSGGLCLKPRDGMASMKMDMAGAAAVLGVFKVLGRLKVRSEVHVIVPLVYNMPGPGALAPGDVVRAMDGTTIEVLNTDAEGRLILADALVYARKQRPDLIIDLATLTGAVSVALGDSVAGAMTNNKPLLTRLMAASRKANEPVWELPLVREYRSQLKSGVADLKNIGRPRKAGSIIGGLFLREFAGDVPWVHLDIAGTAWSDRAQPYCPAGGTGSMVRTLLEFLTGS